MFDLNKLDQDLANNKNDQKTNINLAIFVIFLFLCSQALEFLVLTGKNYKYADLCRFDCAWYSSIIDRGYDQMPPELKTDKDQRNVAFFPVFPLIAKLIKFVFSINSSGIALIITSRLFFLLSIFAFIKLAKKYTPQTSILTSGLVVAFNPYLIYANSGYTESLFLFLTCICFCHLKEKKYLKCGILGAILSATRIVGICFTASWAISSLKEFFRSNSKKKLQIFLGLSISTLGLICFATFLHFHTQDYLAFIHINKAPGWNRNIGNPVATILNSNHLYFSMVAMLGFVTSIFFAIRKNYELAIFSFLCTVIPLSAGLMSMPRFILFQAPVLLMIGLFGGKKLIYPLVFFFICSTFFVYDFWFASNNVIT